MRHFKNEIVLTFFLILYSTPSFSEIIMPVPPHIDDSGRSFILYQVVQDEVVFNYSTIKSAKLIEKNMRFVGLYVELKPKMAEKISEVSKNWIKKKGLILFNNRIVAATPIQSPLSGRLLITGLSKQEAQAFLMALVHMRQKHEQRAAVY